MPPLTRKQLNQMNHCGNPDCQNEGHNQIYFHGRCHPRSPTWSYYDLSRGIIVVQCSVCRTMIVEVSVEPGHQDCVHVLMQGRALCDRVRGVPSDWPEGHKWVRAEEADKANCPHCIVALSKGIAELTAKWRPQS